jgi:hypothetical protein
MRAGISLQGRSGGMKKISHATAIFLAAGSQIFFLHKEEPTQLID